MAHTEAVAEAQGHAEAVRVLERAGEPVGKELEVSDTERHRVGVNESVGDTEALNVIVTLYV